MNCFYPNIVSWCCYSIRRAISVKKRDKIGARYKRAPGYDFKGGFMLSESKYKFDRGFNSSTSLKTNLNILNVNTSQSINLVPREKSYDFSLGTRKEVGVSSGVSVKGIYQFRAFFKH